MPQDTPVDLAPGTFLPATGPYMIHSYTPKQDADGGRPARHGRLELVRNPHFHVWSPAAQPAGYPDRIVLETGYTDKEAEAQVADGRADLLWLGAPPADVDTLRTRYGSQLHTNPGNQTGYLFLNTTKPPFDKIDARRALAYALDRRSTTNAGWGPSAPVTCQLIPPDFAAYQPYCPFTVGGGADGQWTGQDVATAQQLVRQSGTRGSKVIVVFAGAANRERRCTHWGPPEALPSQSALGPPKIVKIPPVGGPQRGGVGAWGGGPPPPGLPSPPASPPTPFLFLSTFRNAEPPPKPPGRTGRRPLPSPPPARQSLPPPGRQ